MTNTPTDRGHIHSPLIAAHTTHTQMHGMMRHAMMGMHAACSMHLYAPIPPADRVSETHQHFPDRLCLLIRGLAVVGVPFPVGFGLKLKSVWGGKHRLRPIARSRVDHEVGEHDSSVLGEACEVAPCAMRRCRTSQQLIRNTIPPLCSVAHRIDSSYLPFHRHLEVSPPPSPHPPPGMTWYLGPGCGTTNP
eukprot:scaffold6641_cov118-Isochrysis_galbana.AAC.2